jgi:hypothetical protein
MKEFAAVAYQVVLVMGIYSAFMYAVLALRVGLRANDKPHQSH